MSTNELNDPGLTQAHNIHDSEVLEIQKVLDRIQARGKQRRDIDAFTREIHQRFAEIGFKVNVNWYTVGTDRGDGQLQKIEGRFDPEITIVDRISKTSEFDHDKKVWEVTKDILDLGTGGVISSNEVDQILGKKQGHKH